MIKSMKEIRLIKFYTNSGPCSDRHVYLYKYPVPQNITGSDPYSVPTESNTFYTDPEIWPV